MSAILTDWKGKDRVDEWIASLVKDQTFADIGGIGVNAENERVTSAGRCGARSATMVDIRPSDYYEWDLFREKCAQLRISDYQERASIDINDRQLYEKIGSFDIVHCTGILYHMPSPLLAFEQLASVVEKYLIVNTVTIPEQIENQFGSLHFPGSLAVFLPGINDYERSVLREHYWSKFEWQIDEIAPRLEEAALATMPWRDKGQLSCWPCWWFFTDEGFRAVVKLFGFNILDEYKWRDHTLQILAEKISPLQNLPTKQKKM